MIKFFEQEAAFSIGYRAVKARRRGDVRELHDVELYEVSPVLFGAHPDARLIGVKAGRPPDVEYKATTGVLPAQRQGRRDADRDPLLSVWPPGRGGRARRAAGRGDPDLPAVRGGGR